MSGGGRKERAANSLEEERSRWLFVVTVVHACPEYLRAGDGLNYFHVPLRVNDRTIDDKSQIRSIPLPLNFSLSNSRGEKSDTARFRLRATTRETAIRVLGKKGKKGIRAHERWFRNHLPILRHLWESWQHRVTSFLFFRATRGIRCTRRCCEIESEETVSFLV